MIVSVHDAGPLIRSRNGLWLAIPTPAAGKALGGRRIAEDRARRRITLEDRARAGHRADLPAVAQVKLPKRPDLDRDARAAVSTLQAAILAAWE